PAAARWRGAHAWRGAAWADGLSNGAAVVSAARALSSHATLLRPRSGRAAPHTAATARLSGTSHQPSTPYSSQGQWDTSPISVSCGSRASTMPSGTGTAKTTMSQVSSGRAFVRRAASGTSGLGESMGEPPCSSHRRSGQLPPARDPIPWAPALSDRPDVLRQVLPGQGGPAGHELGRGALEDHPPAVVPCAGAEV